MSKYSMGIDFGTLSGRAVIIDIEQAMRWRHPCLNFPMASCRKNS